MGFFHYLIGLQKDKMLVFWQQRVFSNGLQDISNLLK